MEKRYGALRFIGTVYKVLGVIAGIITIVAVIGVCLAAVAGGAAMEQFGRQSGLGGAAGGLITGIVGGVLALLYGGALSVSLYGLGEGLYLLIALEENTRATMQFLQQQATRTPGV